LTDAAIRAAKPGEKRYKLADGEGLYVEVASTGGKWWRIKYRFAGKEKRLSLGMYPDVGLKDARRRDDARELPAQDVDPSAQRQAHKAEAVAVGSPQGADLRGCGAGMVRQKMPCVEFRAPETYSASLGASAIPLSGQSASCGLGGGGLPCGKPKHHE